MVQKKWLSVLLVLVLMAGMFIIPGAAFAEKPELNKEKLTMITGTTYQLELSGAAGTVKWTSSNKKIATVSKSGLVTAMKKGSCTITAKAENKSYKCRLTVKQAVKGIKLNKSKLTLKQGKTFKLTATVTPKNAANKAIKWTSSNKAVATVNAKGVVTAVGEGTAKITATAKDGSRKKAVCTVTVAAGYKLGSFSKFMMNATYKTASDYLAGKENYGSFWRLINENWIVEKSVSTIESKGIFVFARPDAMDWGDGKPCGIRTYRFFDENGKLKIAASVTYAGDHDVAVETAARLNAELAENGKDGWGYYGKVKHFACGDCLVTLEGVPSLTSNEYGTFKKSVELYRDVFQWTVHAY